MRAVSVLAICIAASFLSFSSFENPLERIVAGFKKYLDELPQEKVYLHLDRPYYTSGETIWMKAYLIAGEFHQPSALSRTIYVELINDEGKLVKQLKLHSLDGSAAGNIDLPDSLPSANYLLRAYTSWMKNGDEDYFFHRSIKIWNALPAAARVANPKRAEVDVQFFPEGGNLVVGTLSKVAVKAISSDGLGKSIEGKIVDESDSFVTDFKTNHLGMGVFLLVPEKGKRYTAIIENLPSVKLPRANESGLVLSVKNQTGFDDVFVTVQMTDYQSFETIYILAQTRGIVCYAARAELNSNFLNLKIPKSKFPDGVAQITVIDSNGIPLAERLVFINNGEQLNITITADKPVYKPRELITLQISATDRDELPVAANLSLAVCDDQQSPTDENRETIASYLLLSSELRGLIESPGYYFNPANKDRAEALDNLLLTQGWRRFSLKNAMKAEVQKPKYKIEQGLTIKGKMVRKYSDKPIADGKVTYVAFGSAPDTRTVHTNSHGEFEINDIVYFEEAKAALQGETKRGLKEVKLVIQNSTFPDIHFPLFYSMPNPTKSEQNFSTRRMNEMYIADAKTIMLKEVTVMRHHEMKYSSMYGPGTDNVRVAGVPYLENAIHPLEILRGRVAGLLVFGSGQTWDIQIRGINSMSSDSRPLIMVDDMPVDVSTLSMIPVHDIETYSVWKGVDAAIFGARGANGVIGFYTKKGERFSSADEVVFPFSKRGYQVEREFYAPKYDVEISERRSDNRATLFWAPHIQTNNEGMATVSFYNHDLETNVTAVLEGISAEGVPGTATVKYEIKKN